MTVKEIVTEIEGLAPIAYQESYDNAGLAIGKPTLQVAAVLICLDVTEDIVDEAIELEANLIISHHPVIFNGLKRLNGNTATERIVMKAITHNIALYAAHTNLDSVTGGINTCIANKLGLINQKILSPKKGELLKLVTFVPASHADVVRSALFQTQAGHIGNYSCCSYNAEGKGTFKAEEGAQPFVGEKGIIHTEPEVRIETIVKRHLLNNTVNAMLQVHPYEEVAYDIYPLENALANVGLGVVGNLPQPVTTIDFLQNLKNIFSVQTVRHSAIHKPTISRVAVCGGSGSSFMKEALQAKADVLVTADCKYHQFMDATGEIILADIGHYESEYLATEIFYEILSKKFPNLVLHITKSGENPVKYI